MASSAYPLLLTKSQFPFRADLHPRTALADTMQNPQRFSQEARELIPSLIYAENVLPCLQGYDSLDEIAPIPDYAGAFTPTFDKVYSFLDEVNQEKFLFSPAQGRAMLLKDGDVAWVSKLNLAGNPICSRAERQAINYFWFRGFGPYRYNAGTTAFDAITFTGLVVANIKGICAASNYILAHDNTTIYYSLKQQVAAAIDFTPALGQAGSLQILGIRGTIQVMLPFANGCIIYSDVNAVMGSYSGDINNPFTFREIPGSAGVKRDEEVAEDTNIGVHFAWTSSGLQQISPDRASDLFPELNDFIKQRVIESFNFAAGNVTRTTYANSLCVQINVLSHRYLCISYGPVVVPITDQVYLEALVFDLDLKRWGKLRQTHTTIFNYSFTGAITALTWDDYATLDWNSQATVAWNATVTTTADSRNLSVKFATLGLRGEIKVYERSNLLIGGTCNSKIILGKLAVLRSELTEFNELHLESSLVSNVDVYSSDNFDPYSYSRSTVGTKYNYSGSTYSDRWLFRATARFHSAALRGRFHLTTALAFLDNVGGR